MKNTRGITLVALVITIIVLLILAGVTISLVIGDNGLLNKAQYAGEEYTKSAIKEEIELGIMDINAELASKTPPQGLTKQEIMDRLQDHIQEVITIDTDMTGEYKGYEYWIDDDYVVHIGDKVNGIKARLNVKVGTSYLVLNVNATSTFGAIKEYAYFVNGSEVKRIADSMYTLEGLEPETTYTLQVLVIDEKGNEKLTVEKTVKTEARTYLYQEGNEYTELTGGWKQIASNVGTFTKESGYMQLDVSAPKIFRSWNSLGTSNTIDITNYSKIHFEIEFSNAIRAYDGWRTYVYCAIGTQKFVDYDTQNMIRGTGFYTQEGLENAKHIVTMDISDINEKIYVSGNFVFYSDPGFSNNYKIYNVWLEK